MSLSISSTSNSISIDATTNTITFSAPGPAGTPGATGATGETGSAFPSGSPLVVQTEPMSPGERLAKQAVWWIDAAASGSSAAGATNLGWGGTALNAAQAVTANQPKWLEYTGTPYVWLSGVSTNYLSVPDEAALDIVGDLDVRCRVALDDWTPAADSGLLTKWAAGVGNNSYALVVKSTGALILYWSADGTAINTATSTASTGIADGATSWVRATLDVDNGAAGRDVKFWTSSDGTTWTQLGTTVTTAGVTSIFSGTASANVGCLYATVSHATGKFHRAIIKNGIDGTTVLDIDTSVIGTGSATSFNALTGQTVTINRSTTGRKAVAVVAPVWLFGTDDYLEVADNDLLDFGATDSFTVVAGVREWASTVSNSRIISKNDTASAGNLGWTVRHSAANADLRFTAIDADELLGPSNGIASFGSLAVVSYVLNRSLQFLYSYLNAGLSTAAATTTLGDMSNALPVRVGRNSGATTSYADMEFTAAMVFRRALSATEITVLSDWLKGRGY
jgi:hypothetical protein